MCTTTVGLEFSYSGSDRGGIWTKAVREAAAVCCLPDCRRLGRSTSGRSRLPIVANPPLLPLPPPGLRNRASHSCSAGCCRQAGRRAGVHHLPPSLSSRIRKSITLQTSFVYFFPVAYSITHLTLSYAPEKRTHPSSSSQEISSSRKTLPRMMHW